MVEQAALGTAGVISEALSINHREMQTGVSDLLSVHNPALETQPVGVPTNEGVDALALTNSSFSPPSEIGGASIPVHSDNLAALLATTPRPLAGPGPQGSQVLWYTGDFDGRNGLANELNTAVTDAKVYDAVLVRDDGGWTVNALFSNNLDNITPAPTRCSWEIRTTNTGEDELWGDGGQLLFSGTTACTHTATGRSGFGFNEFTDQVDVSDQGISLDAGKYWMNVTPIGSGSGRSFNTTTSHSNAVGDDRPRNFDAYWDSRFFMANFQYAAVAEGVYPVNQSMGVIGTVNM
jgi:hypothetical protein